MSGGENFNERHVAQRVCACASVCCSVASKHDVTAKAKRVRELRLGFLRVMPIPKGADVRTKIRP